MNAASTLQLPYQERRARQRRRQRITSAAAFILLITAWLFGYFTTGNDAAPHVIDVLPQARRIEANSAGLFTGYAVNEANEEIVIGYAMAGSASGYGGPVTMLVGTDPDGNIVGVKVIEHRETPNFFRQLYNARFLEAFTGASYADPLVLGLDLDGVSGATLSAEAVAISIRQAVRGIGSRGVGATLPPIQQPVKFGLPEITLIVLFVVSFVLHRLKRQPGIKKYGRWAILLTGIVMLGFVYNKPFTLANVVSLIAGYWPDWHNNLYWFLLLGGIFTVTLIQGKNPYCSWFCPFGGVQEILGTLTGAKVYHPHRVYNTLRWFQRGLAFIAIVLGLALRQPGSASYEPFGTLFDLEGTWPQWVLLVLVLLASLVFYRPFCNYICPLAPVVDYIGDARRWVKNLWQERIKTVISPSSKSS
jgi:NosR/NirI family nitrous oxide reductase transcriptional regulator